MMIVLDEVYAAKARLREWVARKGSGPASDDGLERKPGWLLRDVETLLNEADLLAGMKPPKRRLSWADVWALFDKKKPRA